MKLGVDLGSTYSMFATCREQGGAYAIAVTEGESSSIPSVVALSRVNHQYLYGAEAKDLVGSPEADSYTAFKMLLPENDPVILEQRGYSNNSPENVTKVFLKHHFGEILERYNKKEIKKLVICAPEKWNDDLDTLDGKNILRKICMELAGQDPEGEQSIDKAVVQVVSEPAAASAFFAYNYRETMGKPFAGNLLLIDYGGGTLDITLTEIAAKKEDEKDIMQITVKERAGVGENVDGFLGKAGMAYQEAVLKLALLDSGQFENLDYDNLPKDNDYKLAQIRVEKLIKNKIKVIREEFDMTNANLRKQEKRGEKDNLGYVMFKEKPVYIKFSQLIRAYESEIAPVLEKEVLKMQKLMDEEGIDYRNSETEKLKIEVVGGFGNFYLVMKQVERLFEFTYNDGKKMLNFENREQAVALGAALLANGAMTIKNTAPYSIGIYCKGLDEYAIFYQEEVITDKIYWQKRKRPKNDPGIYKTYQDPNEELVQDTSIRLFYVDDGLKTLLINSTKEADKAQKLPIKPEQAMKLKMKLKNNCDVALGFSFSSSGMVSLHVAEYLVSEGKFAPIQKIPLALLKDVVDVSAAQNVMEE